MLQSSWNKVLNFRSILCIFAIISRKGRPKSSSSTESSSFRRVAANSKFQSLRLLWFRGFSFLWKHLRVLMKSAKESDFCFRNFHFSPSWDFFALNVGRFQSYSLLSKKSKLFIYLIDFLLATFLKIFKMSWRKIGNIRWNLVSIFGVVQSYLLLFFEGHLRQSRKWYDSVEQLRSGTGGRF